MANRYDGTFRQNNLENRGGHLTGDLERTHAAAATRGPLHNSETRFQTLAAATPAAIFECDLEGKIHFANERWFDLVSGDDDSLAVSSSDGLVDRIHPDDLTELAELWSGDQQRSVAQGFASRCRIINGTDSWRWIDVRLTPITDDDGLHTGYIGVLHDVTDLVEAQHASRRFQTILETTSDLVAIVDDDLTIQYLNPAARAAAGLLDAEVPAASEIAEILLGDDYANLMVDALASFETGDVWSGETPFRRASGVQTSLSHVIVRGADEDGTPWYASLARDLSESRVQLSTVSNTERHDGLTGLLNRAAVFAEVRRSLERVVDTPLSVGLLSIDIDQFQLVNDSYGHDVGDELLIHIAQRLRASSGPNTVLGRFGSDDFIVLVEGMTSQAAMFARAQFLRDRLTGEVHLSAGPAHLTVSIGVITDDGSTDAGDLLRDVDATASLAKSRGRGRIEVFDHRVHDQVVTRLATELEIRHGLGQQQFVLHYQPVIDLASRRAVAFEALVRWQHPRYGLLGPDAFLPVVEECGLSSELGSVVLDQAISTAARWNVAGFTGTIAVNVAADQLYSNTFVAEIEAVLRSHDLDGSHLCVEVTEGIVMADTDSAAARLQELRARGVTVAIDDFGTGYSSLSHLTRLPVDVLKVDKTFVQGLGMHAHDDAVTATVVRLGQSLGLRVIAEGVETPDQLAALDELGCDAVQGFLFSRPVAAEEVPTMFGPDRWDAHQPR